MTQYTMPVPMMNILNGGKHAANSTDFQEFMVTGASNFAESLRMVTEVYHALKQLLKDKGLGTNVGDEGGFAPLLLNRGGGSHRQRHQESGLQTEQGSALSALDPASSEFYQDGRYVLARKALRLPAHRWWITMLN